MNDQDELCDAAALLAHMPFVQEFGITVVSSSPGEVIVEMPYSKRFSTPPGLYPASVVGLVGDVAAVSSCLSLLPVGWAVATLDYTIKMTGKAEGEKLRARGRVLQHGRTTSVGAAEIFAVSGDQETLCGSVLATSRNFQL